MPVSACPGCGRKISYEPHESSLIFECAKCGQRFRFAAAVEPPPERKVAEPVTGVDDITRGQHQKFCHQCGATIHARAEICPRCGVRQASHGGDGGYGDDELDICGGKKIAAGILGILLGALGIHKFVLGLTTPGIIMLLVSIVTAPCFGAGAAVMAIIGLIEGIIYLCTPDRQFYRKYIVQKQGWF